MMENQNYEKNQGGALDSQNPPAYSEKQLSNDQQYPTVHGQDLSMGIPANPAMPPQYPSYGVAPGQGPIAQPLQYTAVVVPAQPTHEPDYLAYSIFTMLCCCLPLGIAAVVYSVKTRDANRMGNSVAAQRNSRVAQILAHSALGIGIIFLIVYIVLVAVYRKPAY